ncbi:shufflon system plasmid conjugative transfer pilus tip adhesin PilV [Dickeya dadantii]|uniref:shufflon system plasmid conjugative transfer pilus tip adhesin PilV n=1 Tax=Dickeya dadantii TaxID=204038 RepID=UPI001495BDE8|nr:shufflon system plasmid conjugative transfer pilus tip adhesin PilV [Dickeya dadantii]NPE55917.1 shufflon system plasmid conjugative transfer pilus tip adhesin PilV [Dickeya dadantii]NPE67141.1 shufflon system plasmid conjugative transfer pilus tip adhesin PilV [Dickeya dadantii]
MKIYKKGAYNILDAKIAIAISAVIFTFIVIPILLGMSDSSDADISAIHMAEVSAAADRYISDNYTIINGSASTSVPYTFSADTLKNSGYLPTSFAVTNNYMQAYTISIIKNTDGKFHTIIVTTGGTAVKEGQARKVALKLAEIKQSGAYVKSNVANGVNGGWSESLSQWKLTIPDGHWAIGKFFGDSVSLNDYLYRKSIPGHPELNVMSTDLGMGGNNINAANNVNAATVNTSGNVNANGNIISKADVSADGNVNANNVSARNSIHSDGNVTSNGDIWTGSSLNANGNLYVNGGANVNGLIRTNGTLQLGEVNVAGAWCPEIGRLSHDASGAVLSCQNWAWSLQGGRSTNIAVYQCPYSICDNNSASTCAGQLSTESFCQCRAGGQQYGCNYVGKLITGQ